MRFRTDRGDGLIANLARTFLHGGAVSVTLDVVGGIAAMMTVIGRGLLKTRDDAGRNFSKISTVDMRINCLDPGVGEGFDASATVLRPGSQLAVTGVEFRNDEGTLVTVGTVTSMVG